MRLDCIDGKKEEEKMKKIVLGSIIVSSFLFASTEVFLKSSFKDYDNAKYKVDGKESTLGVSQTYSF